MLFPVECFCGRRIWVEVSINYEKYIFTDSVENLAAYFLRYATVKKVYKEEEIAYEIKKTIHSLLNRGLKKNQIVEEISEIFGISYEYAWLFYERVENEIIEVERYT
jgi:hypothetical protein